MVKIPKLRGQICGNTLNIYQDILKSGNLLHKQGFVDSQSSSTVEADCNQFCMTNDNVLIFFLYDNKEVKKNVKS